MPTMTKPRRRKKTSNAFSVFDAPFDDKEEFNNRISRFDSSMLERDPAYNFEEDPGPS